MTTTQQLRLDERVHAGHLPEGWGAEAFGVDTRAQLSLVGPLMPGGLRPRIAVHSLSRIVDLAEAPEVAWAHVRASHPHALLTNQEPWHHPVWGQGAFVQSAHLEPDGAIVEDRFVFPQPDHCIVVELTCALVDLLVIEEQVAAVVAGLRPEAG